MIYRDPKCVHVAKDAASANMISGLLDGAGFPSQVMNEATLGGFEGVTGLVPGFSHKGVEVWVVDTAHVEGAKEFLQTELHNVEELQKKRESRTGTTTVVCEECGKSSEWPAAAMGTTENCPHCSQYMDIPDPDDDWSGVDFGDPEEEEEPPK